MACSNVAPDDFGRCLATGLLSRLRCHCFINLSVVLCDGPAEGIPPPISSYGGSSICSSASLSTGVLTEHHPTCRVRRRNSRLYNSRSRLEYGFCCRRGTGGQHLPALVIARELATRHRKAKIQVRRTPRRGDLVPQVGAPPGADQGRAHGTGSRLDFGLQSCWARRGHGGRRRLS